MTAENEQKKVDLKTKEEEIQTLRLETQRLTKMRETIQRKLRTTEDMKADVEQQKETLKGACHCMHN